MGKWRRNVARLVLISKGKGDPELLCVCRPLCMLDSAEKVPELLIRSRLAEASRAAGDLSPRQLKFRSVRSTVEAIMELVDAVH